MADSKKAVLVVAALLLAAVLAAPPAAAMDCKAGCAELKNSPLGLTNCEKRCEAIAKEQGPKDPNKAALWDIP